MKHEYRKHEKELYDPKPTPRQVNVPSLNYIAIDGKGNPNTEAFSSKIESLFTLAYTLKMFPRKGVIIPDYYDYTVYPLEGVWDLSEKGRQESQLNKDELVYTIMIRQPSFITESLFKQAVELNKHKNINIPNVYWHTTQATHCVQMMHIGSFDSEPLSFNRIESFCEQNGLTRLSKIHREIYLSDFRKTKQESLKTILQVEVTF
jgi:hypothetical protein